MKKLTALFLSFCLLFVLLTGCTPNETSDTGTTGATTKGATEQTTTEAKEKRILQVSLEGVPDSLDPHVFSGSLSKWGTSMMHDFLIRYDKDLNIIPGIAESWDFISETEVKFILRDDVYFHNGRKVVAQDVKNTYERILNEELGSQYYGQVNSIESIEVDGDTTVTFKLAYPYSPILARMTQIAIIPLEEEDKFATEVVGCGPFKFSDYQHDQYVEMIRFEDYYEADKVKIDGIRFTFLPEYNAARTAFLAGDLDILLWTDANDVPSMESNSNVTVVPDELLAIYYVGFDCTREPFDDERVRRAVYLALDRQQYVNSILSGNAETLFSLMSNSSYYYNTKWNTEQDIEAAKALLAEAGFPNGFETTITTPNTAVEGPIGEILQAQLSAIGITAKLEKPDVATFLDQVFTKNEFEVMICGTTGFGDPDEPAYTFLHPEGKRYNIFKYQNEEVWDLLEKGRSVYEEADRKPFYDEAFQMIYEDAPIVPIMSETRYATVWNHVQGFYARQNLTYEFSEITINE